MIHAIEKRVKEIDKEVNELHPILKELFSAMPDIRSSYYTHGSQEMGADFVLVTPHGVFKTEKYVGVVVKNTGITQATEDVERQIGECFDIKRVVLGEMKEVQINEVWVITTQNISTGAKTKLHARFSGKSVVFINGNELASLISEYIPNFLTGLPVNTSLYLEKTKVRNLETDKNYNLVPSQDFNYIHQDIVKIDEDFQSNGKIRRTVEKIDIVSQVGDYKFILIEGGFGSGKSKLLRRIVDNLCDTTTFMDKKLVPIDISFREFYDQYNHNLSRLYEERISFAQEGADYEYVFLIDGLDEKNLDYTERTQIIESLRDQISDVKYRVVLTSRPIMNRINYKNKIQGITKYEVSHLSPKKIFEFIEKICKNTNIHKRLIEDIKSSPLMRDLPNSPVAAILLAQLIQQNSQDLPSNITELYSKYFELAIGRWDMQKNMQSSREYEIVENVLMAIAEIMVTDNRGFLTLAEVKMHISNYTSARVVDVSADHIFDLLKLRNDIVIVDENASQFLFKHRSFCEYAFARKLTRSQNFSGHPRAFEVYWANIYFFAFGITKDASKQLQELNDYRPKDDVERFFKVARMPDFALAAYATRYSDIQNVVQASSVELSELYLDIINKRSTLFENVPKMLLLYICQMIYRNSYSYDLFKPALESSAYKLAEGEPSDSLPYSLFLLNTALVDIDENGNLDLLTKLANLNLPIDLALALKSESDKLDVTYEGVKKNNRRVKRFLKNKELRLTIKELYEKPISKFKKT